MPAQQRWDRITSVIALANSRHVALRHRSCNKLRQNLAGSDEELLQSLDAVIICSDASQVEAENSNAELTGVIYRFDDKTSLVYSNGFDAVVGGHIGQPVSLRSLNQLSRDIINYYRRNKQPVVDVIIPEQKITGGTVQLIVKETRIGDVVVRSNGYFDSCMLTKWVACTRRGSRIYEPWIENDLYWLSQNPFRTVSVDLRPGEAEGTTDVIFDVNDVRPVRAYVGYDDTGVQTLGRERLQAGFIYGNAFGRDGTLSYQYTAEGDFRRLHAHAVSFQQPINRCQKFQAYGSWAGVEPTIGGGLTQHGESWQLGASMTRHLIRTPKCSRDIIAGVEFKSTNNNLEFGGQNVQASAAELMQLQLGFASTEQYGLGEYRTFRANVYTGPG